MPKYVALVTWTDKGIAGIQGTTDRADQVAKLAEKHGGKLDTILWTMGKYDMVTVFDLPDDESMALVAAFAGSGGNVRTESMRAFTADEVSALLEKLG